MTSSLNMYVLIFYKHTYTYTMQAHMHICHILHNYNLLSPFSVAPMYMCLRMTA